jgi:hypothetical protein
LTESGGDAVFEDAIGSNVCGGAWTRAEMAAPLAFTAAKNIAIEVAERFGRSAQDTRRQELRHRNQLGGS